jgi:hypothetical protein
MSSILYDRTYALLIATEIDDITRFRSKEKNVMLNLPAAGRFVLGQGSG